jgi:hypothetical protein
LAAPGEIDPNADPLAEFERRPPTREQIDERFARVPKPARDEIEKWANEATRLSETTQKLGGEHGLALATQLLPLVTDPNPSEADD